MEGLDFTAPDPEYADRVHESFARQAAMATFGVEITDVGPGWVDFSFDPPPGLTQQDGFVHAGVIAAALDSACGYAAFSLAPAGWRVLTAEYKINLLRPATQGPFLARGRVVKAGRSLTVSQGELTDQVSGKLLAVMTGTIAILEPDS